jgi:hypothetical protein
MPGGIGSASDAVAQSQMSHNTSVVRLLSRLSPEWPTGALSQAGGETLLSRDANYALPGRAISERTQALRLRHGLYFSTRGPANGRDFDGEYSFIIENDRL